MKKDRKGTWDLISPVENISLTVGNDLSGLRLDIFLNKRFPWRSRNCWASQIKQGKVLIDNRLCKASTRVRNGQLIVLESGENQQNWEDPSTIKLDIIYEDNTCLVINKAPDRIVHPVGKILYGTYLSAFISRYAHNKDIVPTLIHRLDRETSGILIVAKSSKYGSLYAKQFENRSTIKHYHAIVSGILSEKSGIIDAPIGPIGDIIRLKKGITKDGQPACTFYRLLRSGHNDKYGPFSLVECVPKTGRTHQIRVHLAHIGHPIIGDSLYGGMAIAPRFMLHAIRLKLKNLKGEPFLLFAPHPEDFRKMLYTLVTGNSLNIN